ncbi:MAG: 3-hydroxyacyl-CoA dehydrogenase NAD-binding domain-containing protein [Pyrinomonadaceae bacterium]
MAKGVALGKVTEDEADAVLQRMRGTVRVEETRDAQLFIEAVPENLELKRETLRAVEAAIDDRHSFVFATYFFAFDFRGRAARAATRECDRDALL